VPSAEKPFSQALFTQDYGLAHALHRDCITSCMSKIVLSHYLQYEAKGIEHAFPAGSTQHSSSGARCSYLWKARPPLRLLTEMHCWLTSEDIVFHVTPADSPVAHVMA
jgi:hypothetical protein